MTSISIDKVDLTSITKYMVPIRISAPPLLSFLCYTVCLASKSQSRSDYSSYDNDVSSGQMALNGMILFVCYCRW